jgi:hypothetical protein
MRSYLAFPVRSFDGGGSSDDIAVFIITDLESLLPLQVPFLVELEFYSNTEWLSLVNL